jgi:hypothetical protein
VGTGTTDIAQLQVNSGDTSLPFQPKSFAEEFALCQRYYEKSYDDDVVPGSATANGSIWWTSRGADTMDQTNIRFKVNKRVSPTMTIYSTGTGAIGKAKDGIALVDIPIVTGNTGKTGSEVAAATNTVSGHYYSFHYAADAEL